MRIHEIKIDNFRSIKSQTISVSAMTYFLGRNGAGKSTVLQALDYFYDLRATATTKDFYAEKTDDDIEIAVTYSDLTDAERREFASYITDGRLRVVKRIGAENLSGTYHGFAQQIPRFSDLRQIPGKKEKNDAYKRLREEFKELPVAKSADEALDALEKYELEHPDLCQPMAKQDQFFGPKNIGGGKLDSYTKFIFIPAALNAADEFEGSAGAIGQLIKVLISEIEKRDDIKALGDNYVEEASKIFESEETKEALKELANGVTEVLNDYAPGSSIFLDWDKPEPPKISFPEVIRSVIEDDYPVDVKRVGHGLQRCLIVAILQYFSMKEIEDEENRPSIIIAFEEPEIYQHPSRCRYLASVLRQLVLPGRKFQALVVTHSPYFVDIRDFDSVRYAKRKECGNTGQPKQAEFTELSADDAAIMLGTAWERDDFTAETFHSFSAPVFTSQVSEGFFADSVILVEGETDLGVLTSLAKIMNLEWERKGVIVIPVGGKTKLDKPFVVFSALGIEASVVFDTDEGNKDAHPECNQALQRLLGAEEAEEYPPQGEIGCGYAFSPDIEGYLSRVTGDMYSEILDMAKANTGNQSATNPIKRSDVASEFIRIAKGDRGFAFSELEIFLENISNRSSGN